MSASTFMGPPSSLSRLRRTGPAGIDRGGVEPSQERQRSALVEHLVQVAALRALDARGAPVAARAALEHPRGVRDPALESVEAALCDADAAGMAVVDEHGRAVRLEVDVRGQPADVPAVAH